MNGKETDSDNLLHYVNSLHPNIRFTCEKEINCEFSFLDVRIIRERTKFSTTVFRKKTNTGHSCYIGTAVKRENIRLD